MPVEFRPNFLDEVLNKGVQGFQMGQGIKARREAKDSANAGLMSELFKSGIIESPDLQSALGKAGINTPVMPGKAERRRALIAQGQGAIDALSDAEKEDLGFKTTAQKKIEAADVSAADLTVKRNDALQRFMSGEDIDDNSREVLGIMTKGDRELKKLTQMDPYLGGMGERYVAGELLKSQGRIPEGGLKGLAENAYAAYLDERSKGGFGGLTPEQVIYTRTFFQRAAQNALIAQKKADLEEFSARTARIGAESMRDVRGQNANLQWFGKMTTALDTVRKQQQDLLRANPALAVALDNPSLASSPMIAGALERYNQLETTAEAFRTAQGSLAEGNVPGNLSALLDAANGMVQAPPAATAGRSAGAAPAQGTKPPGAPPGPTPGVDPAIDQKIEATAKLMAEGKVGATLLQSYVTAGALTPDMVTKITKRAEALKKEAENNRMKGIQADTFSSGGQRRRY